MHKYIVNVVRYNIFVIKCFRCKRAKTHQFVDNLHNIVPGTIRILFVSSYRDNVLLGITLAREINLNIMVTTYFTDHRSFSTNYFWMIFRIDFELYIE